MSERVGAIETTCSSAGYTNDEYQSFVWVCALKIPLSFKKKKIHTQIVLKTYYIFWKTRPDKASDLQICCFVEQNIFYYTTTNM